MRQLMEQQIDAFGVVGAAPAGRARRGRSVTVNLAESPLAWLAARGLVDARQVEAGERLRADYEMASLGPSVTMRWEPSPVAKGRRVASNIKVAMVVPGSGLVKAQAEKEGLDRVFRESGFEWREPGCSMCLAMNADRLEPGERCASTSNRNFEGRQGSGGRTHLVSPAMAAAAAIAGHFVDVRTWR